MDLYTSQHVVAMPERPMYELGAREPFEKRCPRR